MPRTFFDLNLFANMVAKFGNIVGQFGHTLDAAIDIDKSISCSVDKSISYSNDSLLIILSYRYQFPDICLHKGTTCAGSGFIDVAERRQKESTYFFIDTDD